jgi:phage terminase small subunit
MGRRGPKPKPTALKILEGAQPCRINFDEPRFGEGNAEAPVWLDGLAREHWDELAPLLARSRVLSDGDRTSLALLCVLYQRWRDNSFDNQAQDRYLRLSLEFGLTPASRSRIKARPEKPKDDLEDFLEKKAQ